MRRQVIATVVLMLLTLGRRAHANAHARPALGQGDLVLTSELAYVAGLGSTAIPSTLVGAHYFVWNDVSLGAMATVGGAWQPGDDADNDAAMFGLAGVLRHHFARRDRATFFADVAFGPVQATRRVPGEGTHFNFITRTGPGATLQLNERTHLMLAVRYWHLSNARIDGPARNPSLNGAEVAVGLMWRW
jgi:hypothetical protein